ncbi:MAG: hypothetical protein ABSG91_18525 [Syntrophobacteraceae bacterium]|jgi:hypothetical protein
MNGRKPGLFALIFLFGATLLVPAFLTDIASAQCTWLDNLTIVQGIYNPNDYKWQGTWDPRFDPDWQAHYGVTYARDCDRCERSAVRDCDDCGHRAVRDCDRCGHNAVRDCDRCARSPDVSGFRCDLYGCAWVR